MEYITAHTMFKILLNQWQSYYILFENKSIFLKTYLELFSYNSVALLK